MQRTSGSAHAPLGLSQAPCSGHWALSPLPTCTGRGGGGGVSVNSNFHFSPPLLRSGAASDPELVTFCSLRQDHRRDAGCPWFPDSQVWSPGVRASVPPEREWSGLTDPSCCCPAGSAGFISSLLGGWRRMVSSCPLNSPWIP